MCMTAVQINLVGQLTSRKFIVEIALEPSLLAIMML